MRRSKSIHFFATKSDLQALIEAIEDKRSLNYVEAGMFESPETRTFASGLEIPNLGFTPTGDHVHQPHWLVTTPETKVEVEVVPQRRGGVRYAIDQKMNPRSVIFCGGGVFGDKCLIDGNVGTCTDDAIASELANLFAGEIRRRFKRIKSFYVGPEAERLLEAGFRLTTSVKSPKEYDLSRD